MPARTRVAGFMAYAWRAGQTLEELLDDPPPPSESVSLGGVLVLGLKAVVGMLGAGMCVRCFIDAWSRSRGRSELKLYSRV